MRSAVRTVDRRWAMTRVVRSAHQAVEGACVRPRCSLSASRLEVASSRIRMGASLSSARAMAMRWRWPPERLGAALADQVS